MYVRYVRPGVAEVDLVFAPVDICRRPRPPSRQIIKPFKTVPYPFTRVRNDLKSCGKRGEVHIERWRGDCVGAETGYAYRSNMAQR